MNAYNECLIDQYDPENGLPAAALLTCSVHGGWDGISKCNNCMHGFTGSWCNTCADGYYRYNSTLCIKDET